MALYPVLSSVSELAGTDLQVRHHWVRFFTRCSRRKIKLVRWVATERASSPEIASALQYFQDNKTLRPGDLALLTYTGFHQFTTGWALRRLDQKVFDQWLGLVPALYVAEAWDLGTTPFDRSRPVFITEGLLDAECFAEMTGYPFVMAQMTNGLSQRAALALGLLADRVIFVPDNDKAGRAGVERSQKILKQLGVSTSVLNEDSAKDSAEMWSRQDADEIRRLRVKVAALT